MLFEITVLTTLLALVGTAPADSEHKGGAAKLDEIHPLPGENDSFETIQRKGKVYVDKTAALMKLLDSDSRLFYFTRPRKFGKTVFLRMVEKFFLGEKDLFKNLEIYERGNVEERGERKHNYALKKEEKWLKYPVVYLDFSRPDFRKCSAKEFRRKLNDELKNVAAALMLVGFKKMDMNDLIKTLNKKYDLPVVILMDEFDAPVQDAFDGKTNENAKGILTVLQEEFAIIEECRAEKLVGLTFVTGVSRFNIFAEQSGARNFVDLTDDKGFATAIGFTEKEIGAKFEPHLIKFAKSKNTTREEIMKELIEWYEGYQFSSKEKLSLLNPVSTIKCIENHRFDNYWCALGPTQYVLDTFIEEKLGVDHFENFRIERESLFKMYGVDDGKPPFHCFMLYEGFLKITSYDRKSDLCVLDYPNKEIREFLSNKLSDYVVSEKKSISELSEWNKQLQLAMQNQKIPDIMASLKRYGFPILFSNTGHSATGDWGVTRRLHRIFDAASVKYSQGTVEEEGTEKKNKSYIHLQTLELPMNYVFEIECKDGAQEAMLRLVSAFNNSSESFQNAIDNQTAVYMIGMNFVETGGGQLADWICLPYSEGKLKLEEVQTSSKDLENTFLSIMARMIREKVFKTSDLSSEEA